MIFPGSPIAGVDLISLDSSRVTFSMILVVQWVGLQAVFHQCKPTFVDPKFHAQPPPKYALKVEHIDSVHTSPHPIDLPLVVFAVAILQQLYILPEFGIFGKG